MPQIIPIRDLKNTSEVSERCHATSEPIFITKNYEAKMRTLDIHEKLLQAEEQIKEGRIRPAEESLQELKAQYDV